MINRAKIDAEMAQIDYGWVDKNGGRHEQLAGFSDNYVLQLPAELRQSKLGVCWDQVELERELFAQQNVEAHTFFIVYFGKNNYPTHTFLLAKEGDKIVWYEHAWMKHAGWHEFATLEDALRELRKIFISVEVKEEFDPYRLCIYEYAAPTEKLTCYEFYRHCQAGESFNEKLG